MNTNKHWIYLFWFCATLTSFALIYNVAITFIAIPEKNVRFADTFQGFLLGSAISTCITYLIGSSINKPKATNNEQ